MDVEKALSKIVRIGVVTAVNYDEYLARVKFPDEDVQSDWLIVLDNRPFIPDYKVEQRTEYEAGGSGYAEFQKHKHPLKIKQWMPAINQTVLALYMPVETMEKSEGFILGGIQ